MRFILLVLFILLNSCQSVKTDKSSLASVGSSHAPAQQCQLPFVFFDLGETIVDTVTFNYKKIFYLPDVESYLTELKRADFKLGMLVNVPETWGATQVEKLAKLKDFIKGPWTPRGDDFNWSQFSEEMIMLPPKDDRRKPDPYLFREALVLANAAGCKAVFQGEEAGEVKVAQELGLHSFLVKREKNAQGEMAPVFLTVKQLRDIQSQK